jgi:hypothetical protein
MAFDGECIDLLAQAWTTAESGNEFQPIEAVQTNVYDTGDILDLSTLISHEDLGYSTSSEFVDSLLRQLDDSSSSVPSSTCSSGVDSELFENSYSSASSIETPRLDESYYSLDHCTSSLSEALTPDDFHDILYSLSTAFADTSSSTAPQLKDVCSNLAQSNSAAYQQRQANDHSIDAQKEDRRPEACSTHQRSSSANAHEKPDVSYIELVANSIMASRDNSVLLGDIYQWITDNYPYYKHTNNSWRNSIRHNLSVNECFVKGKRVKNGRGFYWSIHASCIDAFKNGDFDRRKARRQVQQCNRAFSSALDELKHIQQRAFHRDAKPDTHTAYQHTDCVNPQMSSTPFRNQHYPSFHINAQPRDVYYDYSNTNYSHW